jgi:hypothetical protein
MVFHNCQVVCNIKLFGLIILLILCFGHRLDLFAQPVNSLDLAYGYYNSGQIELAISIFEDYIKENPKDTRIFLQLGYAYTNLKEFDKANYYFQYVEYNSNDPDEIAKAKDQVYYIILEKNQKKTEQNVIKDSASNNKIDLASAYKYLNDGYVI